MKRLRTAAILFVVLLVLGGIATWDEWKTTQEELESKTKHSLFDFDINEVTEIRYQMQPLSDEDSPVDLRLKKTEGWRVISPVETPADEIAVTNFLTSLKGYQYADVISVDPAQHDEYGVGPTPRRQVSVRSGNNETSLLIGDETPVGYQAYVRLADSDKVYVGSQHIRMLTHKTLFDFRDKSIMAVDPASIESLTFESKNHETLRLVAADGVWQMTHPIQAPADVGEVRGFISALASARATAFYDDLGEDLDNAFADPRYRITFVTADNEHQGLMVVNHGGKWVGSYDPDRLAFELPDNLGVQLSKAPEAFRDRKVLKIDANDVNRVEVDTEVYERKDGVWYDAERQEASHLQALVVDLEFAKTESFLAWDSSSAKGLGSEPLHRLKFISDGKTVVLDLFENKEAPSTFFVKQHGAPFLYQIPVKEFAGMKPFAEFSGSQDMQEDEGEMDQTW